MTTEEFAREMQSIEKKETWAEERYLTYDIAFTIAMTVVLIIFDRVFDVSIVIAKAIELVGTKLM